MKKLKSLEKSENKPGKKSLSSYSYGRFTCITKDKS